MAMDMNRQPRQSSRSALEGLDEPRGDELPLNVVEIQGLRFLRVVVAGGGKLHLVSYLPPGSPRHRVSAKRIWRRNRTWDLDGYEPTGLTLRRWAGRTMCGRSWSDMAVHAYEIELLGTGRPYVCPACSALVREDSSVGIPQSD